MGVHARCRRSRSYWSFPAARTISAAWTPISTGSARVLSPGRSIRPSQKRTFAASMATCLTGPGEIWTHYASARLVLRKSLVLQRHRRITTDAVPRAVSKLNVFKAAVHADDDAGRRDPVYSNDDAGMARFSDGACALATNLA